MDGDMSIDILKQAVLKFRNARKWKRFHDPKNLAAALSIEAAELQEVFLWKSPKEIREILKTEKGKMRVEEEVADILIFLLYLSDACKIDLSEAVKRKIEMNDRKYPIEKSYGTNKKYNELT